MNASLADRLKTETSALHTAAERSAFMQELLQGRMARPAYCALLSNLHTVYASLEPALLRGAADPMIGSVFEPALWRTAALANDLCLLKGPAWFEALMPLPAARLYASRLSELDATEPGLLLAHAYVRYLGDLSGGQILRRIVASNVAIGDPRAVAFYDFGDPTRVRALTRAFRHGLASLRPPGAVADALIAEAQLAFRLHRRLFDELAVECGLVPRRPGADQRG